MNQEQTNITTGKQIRHLRTQLGMTQEELAGELNVTRQALSNWERDVNEPDLNMLKKICFLFGVNMDDFAKEVITKMETYEKKEKRQFNKYDMLHAMNILKHFQRKKKMGGKLWTMYQFPKI
ncbi:helix-turn-helix domain-containing protein [Streptococcus suis]|uniref:helix-turn-helix domain-containing protein n=1 Tax=Streptococcus suis TaxID=1307 RepID=UPI00211C93F9|nr:helix-turn-helix transcriptional regulator [Streptococcus suis]MCQ9223766.1 helix-turn-helix domain-containing protein [Streptococcus suis]MCQ9230448.1 helix-turn-helix domain-containing protein [Streptococcus suis]UUM22535.1 helix-turn-helix domain-containing protein [Streptococcus suis]